MGIEGELYLNKRRNAVIEKIFKRMKTPNESPRLQPTEGRWHNTLTEH